ncbi:MAG: DMT family transporter [Actinomycetales bacterium]|nr:DMT family transporter [Actinomycetales bacterium]
MLTKHRGEFYLVMGSLVFAFNGVISTVVLNHISPFRLAQVRSIGAFFILLAITLVIERHSLLAPKKLVPKLAAYGIIGFAAVQAGYFLGIQRGVPLSLVLIVEFTAPIWIALWIKYVRKSFVPASMWGAIALSLLGLILLAQVWNGLSFDLIGLLGALFSAFALTAYFLIGKSFGTDRTALSLTVWGLGMASLAWICSMPIWDFPFEVFTIDMDLQGIFTGNTLPGWVLILWIIIMGTIVPYLFVIGGLRLLSASTSSVIGMLEPVLAGVFAWIWLEQSWNGIQLVGAVIVLVGIYIADRARSVAA